MATEPCTRTDSPTGMSASSPTKIIPAPVALCASCPVLRNSECEAHESSRQVEWPTASRRPLQHWSVTDTSLVFQRREIGAADGGATLRRVEPAHRRRLE